MSISLITTCKSRLSHLKQTIESWNDFEPDEIIVVDVSCPDQTKEWLAINQAHVRCLGLEIPSFHLAYARNIGAKAATSDYFFFVDADIVLGKGLRDWFERNLHENRYYTRAQATPYEGIHEQGTFLCHRSRFEKIQGYDETFTGYGGEDHDIYFKLNRIGVNKTPIPTSYITSLDHTDEKRTEHYNEKNKYKQSIINRSYSALKEKLLELNPRLAELPHETRADIWKSVTTKLKGDFDELEGDVTTVHIQQRKWLPEPYYLEISNRISVSIKRVSK